MYVFDMFCESIFELCIGSLLSGNVYTFLSFLQNTVISAYTMSHYVKLKALKAHYLVHSKYCSIFIYEV